MASFISSTRKHCCKFCKQKGLKSAWDALAVLKIKHINTVIFATQVRSRVNTCFRAKHNKYVTPSLTLTHTPKLSPNFVNFLSQPRAMQFSPWVILLSEKEHPQRRCHTSTAVMPYLPPQHWCHTFAAWVSFHLK